MLFQLQIAIFYLLIFYSVFLYISSYVKLAYKFSLFWCLNISPQITVILILTNDSRSVFLFSSFMQVSAFVFIISFLLFALGLFCSFFEAFEGRSIDDWFKSFPLFQGVHLLLRISFSALHHLVSLILTCRISIFMQFNVRLDFPWDLFLFNSWII